MRTKAFRPVLAAAPGKRPAEVYVRPIHPPPSAARRSLRTIRPTSLPANTWNFLPGCHKIRHMRCLRGWCDRRTGSIPEQWERRHR